MTRQVLPCLICGRNGHSSASCGSQIARTWSTTHEVAEQSDEPMLLGESKYLQGYLDNPPNMHLRRTKDGSGVDYRADQYRGYESWQFRIAPLGRWDDPTG